MKKIIQLSFGVAIIIAVSYFVLSQENGIEDDLDTEQSTEASAEANIMKFEGVITDTHDGCASDGVCSIEVDDTWWIPIIVGGLRPPDSKPEIRGEVVGITFNLDNETVGKKVEVHGKKVDETSLTIFGSSEYYVRVIGE